MLVTLESVQAPPDKMHMSLGGSLYNGLIPSAFLAVFVRLSPAASKPHGANLSFPLSSTRGARAGDAKRDREQEWECGRECRGDAEQCQALAFVVAPDTAVALAALTAISQTIALLSVAVQLLSRLGLEEGSLLPVLPPCRSYPRPSHYRECRYSELTFSYTFCRCRRHDGPVAVSHSDSSPAWRPCGILGLRCVSDDCGICACHLRR